MSSGKCSLCIAGTLYPLVLLSIICNVVLFFPGWDVQYLKEGHITKEVKYMGGMFGGGFMMFFSVIIAFVGAAGAIYSFLVAWLGLAHGPLCKAHDTWTTPFKDSKTNYLTNSDSWSRCTEPKNVVSFNIGLFVTLMVTSCLQGLLCAAQVINGLLGCLCGTGNRPEKP